MTYLPFSEKIRQIFHGIASNAGYIIIFVRPIIAIRHKEEVLGTYESDFIDVGSIEGLTVTDEESRCCASSSSSL